MNTSEGALKAVAVSLFLVVLLAMGVVLKAMAGVLTQVAVALFAMFLVHPAVNRVAHLMDRLIRRTPRGAAPPPGNRKKSHAAEVTGFVITLLLALSLVGFAMLILYGAGNMLMNRRDDLAANVVRPVAFFVGNIQDRLLPGLYGSLGLGDPLEAAPLDSIAAGRDPAAWLGAMDGISLVSLVPTAANLVGTLTQLLLKLAIITVLTIFMLSGRRLLSEKLMELDPAKHRRVAAVVAGVEGVPRRYLVAKLVTSVLTGLLIGAGLLVWLEPGDAFIWGFIAMVMNFVPFFGSLLAGVMITLYTLSLAGPRGLWAVPMVVAVNNLVSNVIEPNYFGRVLPVGKVTVLVSVLVWGFLWGMTGVFLAVPITIMLKEFLERIYGRNAFTVALEV